MPNPGMYGRLGKVPRRTKPNRTVKPPTESGLPTLSNIRTYYTDEGLVSSHAWRNPSGSRPGDRIVAIINTNDSNDDPITPPAGWTEHVRHGDGVGFGSHYVFSKTWVGDETTDDTFTTPDLSAVAAIWIRFDAAGVSSLDITVTGPDVFTGGADTIGTVPSINPGAGDWWILPAFMANQKQPDPDISAVPTGYDHLALVWDESVSLQRPRVWVAEAKKTLAGAESPSTFGWESGGTSRFYAGFTIAVQADGGAPALLGPGSDHDLLGNREAAANHPQYLLTDGTRAATFLDVNGITGATADSRYVGATASGAPASGDFVVGDYVIDQTGKIHVCTTAGSPGTWTEIGGGSGLPTGGTAGQIVVKQSATDGDAVWEDFPDGAYAETVGDGAETSFALTHSLDTTDVVVQVWDVSSTPVLDDSGVTSITATDADTVTVVFGSAPSTDEYRIVVLASGGSGGGSSGGGSSPFPMDTVPGTADSMDDEFDAGTGMDAKWTAYGGSSIVSSDVNSTIADHLYIETNTNSQISGWYQTLPATPCTFRLKLTDSTFAANYNRAGGLVLLPAGAISGSSPVVYWGFLYNGSWLFQAVRHSALASFAANLATFNPGAKATPAWIDIEVHSTTSVSFHVSTGGALADYVFGPYTVPYTVGKIGIGISGEGVAHECAMGWFRRIA